MTIPGVGPVTASAIVATIQDAGVFASGRRVRCVPRPDTPRQNARPAAKRGSGASQRWATATCASFWWWAPARLLRHRRGHSDALRLWASGMLERKTVTYKFNLTAVALANKVARIVFTC